MASDRDFALMGVLYKPNSISYIIHESSVFIDCHSVCSSYIPAQMMLALQFARDNATRPSRHMGNGPKAWVTLSWRHSTWALFKAHGRCAWKTRLAVWSWAKRRVLVIFDGQSPGMLVAAGRDPLAAIVLHSSERDVDTVVVD